MQTTALAGEIANYAIYRPKKRVIQISEMDLLQQEDVRDTVGNAALHVLNEFCRQSAKDHIAARYA
jgi:hypothetical protein